MKKLNLFYRFFGFLKWKAKSFEFRVKLVADNPNPEKVRKGVVYVVGAKNYVKWAYLKCPDECGEIIMLNLSNRNGDRWSVFQDSIGRASISPSINKLDGCKSHFFIKKGKVIWKID